MEGHLSHGGMIPSGASYGGLDLQGSMRAHHQGQHPHNIHQQHHPHQCQTSSVHPSIHEGFPLTMGTLHNCGQTMSMVDYNKGERSKNSASEEDEPSFTEEGVDGHNEVSKGKKGSLWQRVKWTDKMVKLLITAVSYIGEDAGPDCSVVGRRKFSVLQKKGKWKSVSKVMAERGYHVSPQQCEDKFNDLNKRYKRLNDMLGRGTSCQVVENPALLDVIDYLTEKEKDDVRKILSSKHLFYEEMCSYHNGNRLHLPHDPALQHSLQLALRSRDDHDNEDVRKHQHDDHDEEDQEIETDDREDLEDNNASHGDRGIYGLLGDSGKRFRPGQGCEDISFGNSLNIQDCNKSSYSQALFAQTDINQALPDGTKVAWLQKQWIESRFLQLEERKLQIQVEMLELEKQRLKWQRFTKKRDRELEKLKMDNERMKLENERMALELKRKEMGGSFT
ncbi:sequence-specific DNA binding transcription factor [Trema orientale]|uniref:Sequence-specific DNA binding transcription factor n=1 Tax=Trema orientale TaxID=63057 RepID=A0A2P5EBY0_TREOI|nr:sequence-specific DNA binding transcription factor [Trema orientale]